MTLIEMHTKQNDYDSKAHELALARERERMLLLIEKVESSPHSVIPAHLEEKEFIEVRDHAYKTSDLELQNQFSRSRHNEIRTQLANNLNPHREPLEYLLRHAKPEDPSWDDLRNAGLRGQALGELSESLITAVNRNLEYLRFQEAQPRRPVHTFRTHHRNQRAHGLSNLVRKEGTGHAGHPGHSAHHRKQ